MRRTTAFPVTTTVTAPVLLCWPRQLGYAVPANALADTIKWLRDPSGWDRSANNPGFSNKRLARIQFAAALAEASRAGAMSDRGALLRATELLVTEQEPGGAWKIDTGGIAGAPATYGASLATYMARRTLETVEARQFAGSIRHANQWLRALKPENILDRAAIQLALPNTRSQHLDMLLAAQTSDGGWGPQVHAPAEPFDTAIALLALHGVRHERKVAAAIERGRGFLVKSQLSDGSWIETTRPAGFVSYAERISTAAWSLYSLLMTDSKRN